MQKLVFYLDFRVYNLGNYIELFSQQSFNGFYIILYYFILRYNVVGLM